ncbi:MAG: ABC transporter substrate-binding protein [Alphaproteobacteria bacterium]
MRRIRGIVLAGLGALALAALTAVAATAQQRDKVVLLLNWYNYGEHAPFYLGIARGYYAEERIDLEIQEGRGSGPTVQAVAAGSATFGYADAGVVIRAVMRDAPIQLVGVLVQTSPMGLIGFEEKKIAKPGDLVGKTVAMTPGGAVDQMFAAFARATGLKEGQYKVVSGDAATKRNAVINNQADVTTGHINDQNIFIEDTTGKKVSVIRYADYGVNPLNNGIIARRETLQSNADLVRRFMRASAKSAEASKTAAKDAVDALLKSNPKAGKPNVLMAGFEATIPLFHSKATQGQRAFRVAESDMKSTVDLLVEFGGLDAAAKGKLDQFYTNAYLP